MPPDEATASPLTSSGPGSLPGGGGGDCFGSFGQRPKATASSRGCSSSKEKGRAPTRSPAGYASNALAPIKLDKRQLSRSKARETRAKKQGEIEQLTSSVESLEAEVHGLSEEYDHSQSRYYLLLQTHSRLKDQLGMMEHHNRLYQGASSSGRHHEEVTGGPYPPPRPPRPPHPHQRPHPHAHPHAHPHQQSYHGHHRLPKHATPPRGPTPPPMHMDYYEQYHHGPSHHPQYMPGHHSPYHGPPSYAHLPYHQQSSSSPKAGMGSGHSSQHDPLLHIDHLRDVQAWSLASFDSDPESESLINHLDSVTT